MAPILFHTPICATLARDYILAMESGLYDDEEEAHYYEGSQDSSDDYGEYPSEYFEVPREPCYQPLANPQVLYCQECRQDGAPLAIASALEEQKTLSLIRGAVTSRDEAPLSLGKIRIFLDLYDGAKRREAYAQHDQKRRCLQDLRAGPRLRCLIPQPVRYRANKTTTMVDNEQRSQSKDGLYCLLCDPQRLKPMADEAWLPHCAGRSHGTRRARLIAARVGSAG